MLSKINRLKKEADFKRIYRKGKEIKGKDLKIKYLENQMNFSKFGIVVSLKVAKRAYIRNKLKRQIREIIKKDLGKFVKNFDVVVSLYSSAIDLTFEELKKELEDSFLKSGMIK